MQSGQLLPVQRVRRVAATQQPRSLAVPSQHHVYGGSACACFVDLGAGLTSVNGCQELVYCVHNLQSIHCLQQPEAVEVEGPAWPFQVRGRPMCWCGTWHARPRLSRSLRVGVAILRQEDVPYASRDTAYCSDNLDCPMSYCQVGHNPVGTSAVSASRGSRAHAHGMRPRCGSRRAVCSGSVAC